MAAFEANSTECMMQNMERHSAERVNKTSMHAEISLDSCAAWVKIRESPAIHDCFVLLLWMFVCPFPGKATLECCQGLEYLDVFSQSSICFC